MTYPQSHSLQFKLLATFLVILFFTGGSARDDVTSLLILRPIAVLALGAGLLVLSRAQLLANRTIFCLFGTLVILIGLHAVPLPPAVWQAIPGRQLAAEIDQAAGLGGTWRPLTLEPYGTWNALFAMVVPATVLVLAAQLTRHEHVRLLYLLGGLMIASALLGILQILGNPGGPLYLYRITNNGSVVGLFANRNHQALLLALALPTFAIVAALAPTVFRNAKPIRILAPIMAALFIPLLLVTGSRAGLALGAIGAIFAILLYRRGALPIQARRTGHVPLITPAVQMALMGGGAVALVALTFFLSRAEAIRRLVASGASQDSRLTNWRVIVDYLGEYMPFGSGVGSFVPIYKIHEPDALLLPQYFNHAHNDWLELLLTAGIPGCVLLVVFLVLWLRWIPRVVRRPEGGEREFGLLRQLAAVAVFLAMVASIGDYPIRTPIFSGLLALMLLWYFSPVTENGGHNGGGGRPGHRLDGDRYDLQDS